jgi:FlaG/FlaF family flagellin (archaellin)
MLQQECDRMKTDERGVSPVVGVMLMLSVTVMIAAVVSAAAGSLSDTDKKAPSAILEVRFYENRSYGDFSANAMTIEHVSGNALQTKDLSITTYFRNESGQLVKGSLSDEESVLVDSGGYSGVLFINDQDRFGSPVQDCLCNPGYKSWFGNASAVLMTGDLLVTPAQYYDSTHENLALDKILNAGTLDPETGYKAGAVINVKITHIPSGQVIFDKDVVVV